MRFDPSRHAVFATAELIENILVFLPAKAVFAAQGVCGQFRDIVATSVLLQEKLLLRRPGPGDDERWVLVETEPSTYTPTRFRLRDGLPAVVMAAWRKPGSSYQPAVKLSSLFAPYLPSSTSETMGVGSLDLIFRHPGVAMLGAASWKDTFL